MGKEQRISRELADFLAAYGDKPNKRDISQELAEILAAYGEPPKMPKYEGDAIEYAQAVKVFERLSATPEAVARREAVDRYFALKRETGVNRASDHSA